jgi:hypothetical protein
MALRLRRGTDAQRAATTPADGELIWTTDTQELYVGGVDELDVPIVGGIRITGSQNDSPDVLTRDLDMDGNVLYGTGTINIQGNISTNATVTANAFIGDGSGIYNLRAANLDTTDLVVEGGAYNLNVIADDSTLILDATNQALSVTSVVTNTLTSNNITANEVVSNFIGSFFADDSSTIIDGLTRNAFFNNVDLAQINSTSGEVEFTADTGSAGVSASTADAASNIILTRTSTTDNLLTDYRILTQIISNIDDSTNGIVKVGQTITDKDSIFISHDPTGAHTDYTKMFVVKKEGMAFGTFTIDDKLVIDRGNLKLLNSGSDGSGTIKFASTSQGEVGAGTEGQLYYDGVSKQFKFVDDSTTQVLFASPYNQPYFENSTIVRLLNIGTAARDTAYAAGALEGSIFYNTTTNQMELYNEGAWEGLVTQGATFTGDLNGSVNLDDSTNIIAGDTGRINAPELVNFAQFTTGERDALTGVVGGSVIYNTSTAKLQVYNGSTWVDLH